MFSYRSLTQAFFFLFCSLTTRLFFLKKVFILNVPNSHVNELPISSRKEKPLKNIDSYRRAHQYRYVVKLNFLISIERALTL